MARGGLTSRTAGPTAEQTRTGTKPETEAIDRSLTELLDAVHSAALCSIGMIVDVERAAIVHLHASHPAHASGYGAKVAPPAAYIPGAHGAALVTDDLAEAYRRSLTARLEGHSDVGRSPGYLATSVVLEQAGTEPNAPVDVVLTGTGLTMQVITTNFDQLVDAMMPDVAALRAVPEAIVEAAHRRAELRTHLLATGALSYRDLSEGRSMSGSAVRQWLRRSRERNELFTVEHHGATFVPALLLDEDLMPRRAFEPVISVLTAAGEDGWGIWAWLVFPSPWLDGDVPAEVLRRDPARVVAAARARASNAA